ncbi:MAG: hypothetical protein R3268_05535 [Acidiferrobacterales bacterium]|nr:hypothetical protein [Acidiferrobacterales bacterium]
MRRSRTDCRWVCAGIALSLASLGADGHAQEPWYYTLGKEKAGQQANLCSTEQSVLELVLVFEEQGPRAGYAALDRAQECSTRVQTFTPLALVRRVPIKTGDGGQYVVSFVKVKTSRGATEYLVTTRDVRD